MLSALFYCIDVDWCVGLDIGIKTGQFYYATSNITFEVGGHFSNMKTVTIISFSLIAAVMFKSPEKPRNPLIKRSSLTAPQADKMYPAPSSSSDSTSFPLHPLPAISVQSSLSRQRSRKEDKKKLSKNGILMWHLKVKRLKDHILHQDSSIESDDFYDSS